MNSSHFFSNLRLRAKILVPFLIIIVSASVIGAGFFINGLSRTLTEGREKELQSHALRIQEQMFHQEQRVLIHAQRMAETINLADQIIDTNQIRMFQINELQALEEENIRFVGHVGREYPSTDPLYSIIQLGLKGLRLAALVEKTDTGGHFFRMAGVAPVPTTGEIEEVVVLETRLDNAYLQSVGLSKSMELVLYNLQGSPVVGTIDVSQLAKLPIGHSLLSPVNPALQSAQKPGSLSTQDIAGAEYQVVTIPVPINFQTAGFLAVMEPSKAFIQKRNKIIAKTALFSMSILVLLSLTYLAIVRTITKPIKALEIAAGQMTQGQIPDEIDFSSNDEIGALGRSFQKMAEALRQRQDELQKTLREYQYQSEHMNLLLENMGDGVVVINENYGVEFMNQAAVKTYGEHTDEPCYTFFNKRESACSPCTIEEIIKKGKPSYHYTRQLENGRHFEVIGRPLKDIDGRTKILSLRRDITERVKHFEQQQQIQQNLQKERLKAIHQVGIAIKHRINNSLAAITWTLQFLRKRALLPSASDEEMFDMLGQEIQKIQETVAKIEDIVEVVEVNYNDDVTMIDLEASGNNKKNV